MKFSIGYQVPDAEDSTCSIVSDFRENISSVYFSAAGRTSARAAISPEDEAVQMQELRRIRDMGVRLTLLYNANCYGDQAVSARLRDQVIADVGRLAEAVGVSEVTTTSPFVAKVVKGRYPHVGVCASVNMWIGTVQAMEYLSDLFDSYYLQREYNRDFNRIGQLKSWCDRHGKKLKLLANSGCLYTCPFHTFHDNLVAHEAQMSGENVWSDQPSPCWDYMYGQAEREAAAAFLQGSWIRPQDVARYEKYFSEMKLATRMHSNPRRVVLAYTRGRFAGNALDLTEPSYARRFERHILDATRFPGDWFEQTSNCSRNCEACGYCARAAQDMLVPKCELEKLYLCYNTQ